MKLVLKVSGEVFPYNNLEHSLADFSEFIDSLIKNKHEVCIVVGGGNLFRGRDHKDMDEIARDTIGMLASVINALYIYDSLEKQHIPVILSTPFTFPNLINHYQEDDLIKKYRDSVIIFGGGSGKTGVSTDTKCFETAKLFNADMIIKLTNVDGIYDKDPKINNDAKILKNVSYDEVIKNNLQVIDLNMIEACKINNIKIKIMNYKDKDLIFSDEIGSIIGGE